MLMSAEDGSLEETKKQWAAEHPEEFLAWFKKAFVLSPGAAQECVNYYTKHGQVPGPEIVALFKERSPLELEPLLDRETGKPRQQSPDFGMGGR